MTFRTHRLGPDVRSLRIFRLGGRLWVWLRGSIGGRHFASLGLYGRARLHICYWDGLGPDVLCGCPDPFGLGLEEQLAFDRSSVFR